MLKNITTTSTTANMTTSFPTQTTSMETTTARDTTTTTTIPSTTITIPTTTTESAEETTSATVENNKSYEFQSNFSRNNDSVLVAFHSNVSNVVVSINNTFTDIRHSNYSREILVYEHSIDSNKIVNTKIFINFNESFSRELASLFGDRLIDMADLLSTIRSMANRNNTVENV